MKMFKKAEITNSLCKKGFQETSSKHVKFVLYVDGKTVGIQTVMSYGGGEPGKDLLHQMKKELRFENQRDFEKFIECTYSYEEYVESLKERRIIY